MRAMNYSTEAFITRLLRISRLQYWGSRHIITFLSSLRGRHCWPIGALIHNKRRAPHMLARKLGYLAVTGSLLFSCATVAEAKHRSKPSHRSPHSASTEHHSGTSGMASVYASRRDGYSGGRSASGERVHSGALTAAHRSLPFGTMVRVTNRRNNK